MVRPDISYFMGFFQPKCTCFMMENVDEKNQLSHSEVIDAVNPFSRTLFVIVAKVSLPKRSVPY